MFMADPTFLLNHALIFLRVSAILFGLPIVGDSPTPVRVRILLALALTVGISGLVPPAWAPSFATDLLSIAAYVIREILIGVTIGFVARIAFDGVLMGASIVSYQMGFGTASLFLPDFTGQMDAFTAFHRMIIMLIFLTLGLHHLFIAGIVDSFQLIPGGAAILTGSWAANIANACYAILVIAIQLSAPILIALLFTMAALGLVARTVPQMNVFTMSFPVSFFVGLLVYIATLPMYPDWMQNHFLVVQDQIRAAMRSLTI